MGRTIEVDPVTRIEGHAKVFLDIDDAGEVISGHLQVLEIRGFEKLLDKMELFKMPLITARICGVCPVPHHLVAVHAIESGLGVAVPEHGKLLRELLCLGGIVHSHALSIFVLSGPDLLFGVDAPASERNIFNILRISPDLAKSVLRLRSIGQKIVEIVGGRGIHPVTAVPGGMTSAPLKEELANIASWGKDAVSIIHEACGVLQEKIAALRETTGKVTLPFSSLALSRNGQFTYMDADCAVLSPSGDKLESFAVKDYAANLVERVQPNSYMKAVRLRKDENTPYFVGPLARLNVNTTISTPRAAAMLADFQEKGRPRTAALDYIEARVIELMYAAERITEIASTDFTGAKIRVDCEPREGRYIAAVEAPRGVLIHDYTADKDGRIAKANLIVATQNNYDAINHALVQAGRMYLRKSENELFNGMEFTLRCFDPCLSCATHAAGRMPMEVIVRRRGTVESFCRRAPR